MTDFSNEEIRLLEMIAGSLVNIRTKNDPNIDMHALIMLAYHHSILPIIHPALKYETLSDEDLALMKESTDHTASNFYRLIFAARDITKALEQGGVKCVLLKGASAARFYPVFESRRSSDVDLLLANPKDIDRTGEIFLDLGFKRKKESSDDYEPNHHEVWLTSNGTVIEVHTQLVEPFAKKELNGYIDDRYTLDEKDIDHVSVLGFELPVFYDDRQAFHLFLHMLMDFYRTGFGLKLLCDWVVFWNRTVDTNMIDSFLKDIDACDQRGFLSVLTSTCIRYLGLKADSSGALSISDDKVLCDSGIFCELASDELCREFLMDVLDTERNGKPSAERMVAMESTGFMGLVREFHHQTVLNFPKASGFIIPLPVLYVITLVRFLKNNKRIRGGQSTGEVIKKANERSALLKKINSLP